MRETDRKKKPPWFSAVMKLVLIVSLAAAAWIMAHHMGLSEKLDFGAGAYCYADMPGFEKCFNSVPYVLTVSPWLIVLLFFAWGVLMMKLWLWIDRKVTNGGSGETE